MKTFLLAGMLLMSSVALAGDRGNGGGVHLCNDGKIEMYDIYEGFTRYNIDLMQRDLPLQQYFDQALRRAREVHPLFENQLKVKLKYLLDDRRLVLRSNLKLDLIDDANILVTDIGCRYAQLANWDDVSGNVLVRKEYYDRLDNLNKAALYLHEAIYAIDRETRAARNSDKARRTVAEILSDEDISLSTITVRNYETQRNFVAMEKDPAPVSLNLDFSHNYWKMYKLHFGDHDFYDPSFKFGLTLKYRFPDLEKLLPEALAKKAKLLKEKEALEEQVTKAFWKKDKKKIYDQIHVKNSELYYQDEEIQALEGIQDQLKGEISLSYNREIFKFHRSGSRHLSQAKVIVESQLTINGEVVETKISEFETNSSDTYILMLSQNKK